ncbi:MAG: hypothetical protein KC657_32120 [Myxococcales bacterium]|nr:hypothetical protein [Myxococcales bacterium]
MDASGHDSGLIDLFATHTAASAAKSAASVVPTDAPSLPPPAMTIDSADDFERFSQELSGGASKKKAFIIGGAVAALAVLGIAIAAFSGGSAEPAKAAAAAQAPEVTAPPVAAPIPPPAPSPAVTEASPAPKSPSTATESSPAPPKKAAAKHGKKKGGSHAVRRAKGPKLMKVQSGGVASH